MKKIYFTKYIHYRVNQRKYDLIQINEIVKYSSERYVDCETGRKIAVGNHHEKLILIPYEETDALITPITVHTTTRQQIKFRINTGRFRYEYD